MNFHLPSGPEGLVLAFSLIPSILSSIIAVHFLLFKNLGMAGVPHGGALPPADGAVILG